MCVSVSEEAPEMPSAGCVLSHLGCWGLGISTRTCVKQAGKAAVSGCLKGEGFSLEELSSYFNVSGGLNLMLAKDCSAVFS